MVQPHSSRLLRTCAAPAHLATSSRRCARPVAVACPSWVTDSTCVTYRARLRCREALFIRLGCEPGQRSCLAGALIVCMPGLVCQALPEGGGAIGLAAISSVRRSRWPRARSSRPHSSSKARSTSMSLSRSSTVAGEPTALRLDEHRGLGHGETGKAPLLSFALFCRGRPRTHCIWTACCATSSRTSPSAPMRLIPHSPPGGALAAAKFAAICGRRCSEGGDLRLLPPREDGIIHFHYD